MSRVYNFSAGPAVLPEEVLKEAADEMLDYKGTGMSVMEMSHRSKAYDNIIKAEINICVFAGIKIGAFKAPAEYFVKILRKFKGSVRL